MSEFSTSAIEDVDFDFENSPIKIIATGNLQEVKVAGAAIGPLQDGRELEVAYWIASEFVSAGYAKFHDEASINLVSLNRIHWTETLQSGLRLSSLPEFFYPKLRRYLETLKEKASGDASYAREHDHATRLARDIVNCRLRKIVNLAASASPAGNVLRSLSREERALYDGLRSRILEWKSRVL